MDDLIERVVSILPGALGGISEYSEQFDRLVREHLGAVPLPILYLFCLIIGGLLIYSIAKILFRIALFVIAPAICSSLAFAYAFPTLQTAKVLPIAVIFFVVLYVIKH